MSINFAVKENAVNHLVNVNSKKTLQIKTIWRVSKVNNLYFTPEN